MAITGSNNLERLVTAAHEACKARKPPRRAALCADALVLIKDCADGVVEGERDLARVRTGRGDGRSGYAVVGPSAEGSRSGRRR